MPGYASVLNNNALILNHQNIFTRSEFSSSHRETPREREVRLAREAAAARAAAERAAAERAAAERAAAERAAAERAAAERAAAERAAAERAAAERAAAAAAAARVEAARVAAARVEAARVAAARVEAARVAAARVEAAEAADTARRKGVLDTKQLRRRTQAIRTRDSVKVPVQGNRAIRTQDSVKVPVQGNGAYMLPTEQENNSDIRMHESIFGGTVVADDAGIKGWWGTGGGSIKGLSRGEGSGYRLWGASQGARYSDSYIIGQLF